jgi:hypothetical protein
VENVYAMCFSPEADLVGAAVVGVVGIDTIRQVRERRDWPLATVPLLFAAHFFVETFVWWGLEGTVPWDVGQSATWLYLFIALVIVPSFIPFAVTFAEPSHRRRQAMWVLTAIGAAVGFAGLLALIHQPASAQIRNHCIAYDAHLTDGGQITALYVIAACGVLLLSSSKRIVAYGAANFVVVLFLAWLMSHEFISLWCAWAAITSFAIDRHLRGKAHSGPPRAPSRGAPVGSSSAGYSP